VQFIFNNPILVIDLFIEHLWLSGISLALALLIAIPTGLLIVRVKPLFVPVMGLLEIIYTIPSLSFFVLLIPLFGIGPLPAVIALVAYAQLVLVRNWTTGLVNIDPAILEAADGMGMSTWQRFWRVEVPLALPVLLAGIRLAALSITGIATVAAYISAGGLGRLLFEGVITGNFQKIFAGGLAISLLAIGINLLLGALERRAETRLHF
jgi:osmoprotectant transport system permease protein